MFHAVGLNVIDPRERKSDVLDTSRKALGDILKFKDMGDMRTREEGNSHLLFEYATQLNILYTCECIPPVS